MRRVISPVLVGLGVFLIVAAALVRFYVHPTLATAPADHDSETALEAADAEIFNSDPEVLAPETTDLAILSITVADTEADAPDGVSVWHNSTTVRKDDGSIFQQTRERAAFDSVSGAGVECESCDTWEEIATDERVDVTFEGQIYKFPFNTQQQDYEVWDGTLGEATTATYEGEETIDGLDVYEFVQVIEPTVVETREVPGSVFGSDETSVQAELVYGMTRTQYIEPVTGAPIDRVEERTQELVYDGVRVPAFVGTVRYTDDQVASTVDDVSSQAPILGGMRGLFPLIGLVLGLVLIAVGILLGRGHRSRGRHDAASDSPDRPMVSA